MDWRIGARATHTTESANTPIASSGICEALRTRQRLLLEKGIYHSSTTLLINRRNHPAVFQKYYHLHTRNRHTAEESTVGITMHSRPR